MAEVTQVAFQLDTSAVETLDALAAETSVSRASLLRTAVAELLARRREAAIDAALARGYGDHRPANEEDAWAELSKEGLAAADLDW